MFKLTTRLAKPTDRARVKKMFESGAISYARVPLRDLDYILASRLVIVATHRDCIQGALISIWPRPPHAWLDALTVGPLERCDAIVDALLDGFDDYVALVGARQILCSLEEGDQNLIRERLAASGFNLATKFLRYEKNDFTVPAFDSRRIAVRPARKRDLSAIARIERACFRPPWRNSLASLARTLDHSAIFNAALVDGQIAGFQYGSVENGIGEFIHVAVDPAFRGMNVAKRLLADAIAYFQRAGVSSIELRTEQTNTSAQRLFTGFGFHRQGPHREVFAKVLTLSSNRWRLPG